MYHCEVKMICSCGVDNYVGVVPGSLYEVLVDTRGVHPQVGMVLHTWTSSIIILKQQNYCTKGFPSSFTACGNQLAKSLQYS